MCGVSWSKFNYRTHNYYCTDFQEFLYFPPNEYLSLWPTSAVNLIIIFLKTSWTRHWQVIFLQPSYSFKKNNPKSWLRENKLKINYNLAEYDLLFKAPPYWLDSLLQSRFQEEKNLSLSLSSPHSPSLSYFSFSCWHFNKFLYKERIFGQFFVLAFPSISG